MATYGYLCHHGIKGQKWGVRRYQNKDGSLTSAGKERYSKDSITKHLEKWGTSPDNNILYITGKSGSGKSTEAEKYRNKNTNIIHLDLYLEGQQWQNNQYRDKDFDNFIKKKNFNLKKCQSNNSLSIEERFKNIDKFAKLLDEYSKSQYKNGKKVVVEGVQLSDGTLYAKPDSLYGKPIVYKNTNSIKSYIRAASRDKVKAKDVIYDVKNIRNRIDWERSQRKQMKDILEHKNFN